MGKIEIQYLYNSLVLYKIYTIVIFDGCDQNEETKCMVEDIVEWLLNCRTLYLIQWVLLEKVLDLLCGR